MSTSSPRTPAATASIANSVLTKKAAYFDVDGTLTATNIVMPLIWYKSHLASPLGALLWKASLVARAPYWFVLDRIDRAASNRAIYRSYAGMESQRVQELSPRCFAEVLKPRILPRAMERVAALKRDDVSIVLVTGGLDFVMKPFAMDIGAACISTSLAELDGRYTGRLATGALSGVTKASAVRAHAAEHGIDLKESFAFGDSYEGDLAMLETVGHPSAVNPDHRLKRIAADRGWAIERWKG
jgi:fatty acyl-CoA reductase